MRRMQKCTQLIQVYTVDDIQDQVAEALNCPCSLRQMAPLHPCPKHHSCSNVNLYGTPWQIMTKCKCHLHKKQPRLYRTNYTGNLDGPRLEQILPKPKLIEIFHCRAEGSPLSHSSRYQSPTVDEKKVHFVKYLFLFVPTVNTFFHPPIPTDAHTQYI